MEVIKASLEVRIRNRVEWEKVGSMRGLQHAGVDPPEAHGSEASRHCVLLLPRSWQRVCDFQTLSRAAGRGWSPYQRRKKCLQSISGWRGLEMS